jgi:hypothetical protein
MESLVSNSLVMVVVGEHLLINGSVKQRMVHGAAPLSAATPLAGTAPKLRQAGSK